MSGMAGFQEVGILLYYRPEKRKLIASMLFAEYLLKLSSLTFIRLQKISAGFTRASTLQTFLALSQSLHVLDICCSEPVIFNKLQNKVIANKS